MLSSDGSGTSLARTSWPLLSLCFTLVLSGCFPERSVRPETLPRPALDPATAGTLLAVRFTGVVPTVTIPDSASGAERMVVAPRILAALGLVRSSLRPSLPGGTSASAALAPPTSPSLSADLQYGLAFIVPPAGGKYTYYTPSTIPLKFSWRCVVNGVDLGFIVAQVSSVAHSAIDGSGGHGSVSHGVKPHGRSQPSSGSTDPDGYFRTTYSSGLAAGDEKLSVAWTATGGPPECVGVSAVDTYYHATRWTGLVRHSSSPYLTFASISSEHGDIYYVTPDTDTRTLWAAEAWFDNTNGQTLQLNASSLLFGGINDYRNNWGPPHQSHRTGADVDMDGIPGPTGDTPRIWDQLIQIAELEGGFRRCDVHSRNHVHCYSGAIYAQR
jgi:hypothetical protein